MLIQLLPLYFTKMGKELLFAFIGPIVQLCLRLHGYRWRNMTPLYGWSRFLKHGDSSLCNHRSVSRRRYNGGYRACNIVLVVVFAATREQTYAVLLVLPVVVRVEVLVVLVVQKSW